MVIFQFGKSSKSGARVSVRVLRSVATYVSIFDNIAEMCKSQTAKQQEIIAAQGDCYRHYEALLIYFHLLQIEHYGIGGRAPEGEYFRFSQAGGHECRNGRCKCSLW